MSASDEEREAELRGRYADVIRIAAGLAAGLAANPHELLVDLTEVGISEQALAIVIACEEACGIGGHDDR